MRILVVEGSHDLRAEVVSTLSALDGVVVQGAVAHVSDALRAFDACQFDGVVTGSELPDVVSLLTAARRRRVPTVIVYTPADEDAARQRLLAAGASHVVDGQLHELAATMRDLVRPDATVDRFALLGRITAGIAHDINNYLAAAEVALTFAERPDADVSELRDVRLAFDAIGRLARTLTSYARGTEPPVESVDLNALIDRMLIWFKRIIPHGVEIVVDGATNLPNIRGILPELEQLVLNLVVNACDAMPWGGTLWIVLDMPHEGVVRLEVADSAYGVPDSIARNTGATTPSTKHGRNGAGIGLGIARSVVAHHGGTLTMQRGASGGTKVEIVLPVR